VTRGLFLVLDGVDGCGKSSQARRLVDSLRARGRDPLHVREPGTTPEGERIRALLLDPQCKLSAAVETLLFCASRCQSLEREIEPALAAGRDVVCERFHASTFAYQAVGGGLAEERVLGLLHGWAGAPAPDLELWLALDVEEAARRRGGEDDRIEARGLEFQRAVARGYERYAELTARVRRVAADGSADEVAARIWEEVQAHVA